MGQVIFYDETGVNPLPAGLFVTIYAAPAPPNYPNWRRVNNQIPLPQFDGVTHLGGVFINPNITFQPGGLYGAEFFGVQAPGNCSAHFTATTLVDSGGVSLPTIASADDYRSPSLSQIGYASEQTKLWPSGWFSDDAQAPGGVAYALGYGLGGILGSPIINGAVDSNPNDVDTARPVLNNSIPNAGHWSLDESTQVLLESMRVMSAQGLDIDSWALDILGNVFLRCIDEDDYDWIQQIITILGIFRDPGLPTIAGLQAILTMLYPCLIKEFQQIMALGTQGGVDTWGGLDIVPSPPGAASIALGLDTYGAMDVGTTFMDVNSNLTVFQSPNIIVFDAQSRPDLASTISPNIAPPEFCVYFQYPSFSDALIHAILPFLPALSNLVEACKALGTQVVYASNITQ